MRLTWRWRTGDLVSQKEPLSQSERVTTSPDNSAIEWAEATWNPVTGCDKVSPGRAHCYAETFAERWHGIPGHPYEQGFALKLWPQRLEQPLKWSRPEQVRHSPVARPDLHVLRPSSNPSTKRPRPQGWVP